MKIKDRGDKKFVKIIIGFMEVGKTNFVPRTTKSISLDKTNPQQVYEMIMDEVKMMEEK
jgi:hypothetical protein